MAGLCEGLVTLGTLKRLLACVYPHVHVKFRRCHTYVRTVRTFVLRHFTPLQIAFGIMSSCVSRNSFLKAGKFPSKSYVVSDIKNKDTKIPNFSYRLDVVTSHHEHVEADAQTRDHGFVHWRKQQREANRRVSSIEEIENRARERSSAQVHSSS